MNEDNDDRPTFSKIYRRNTETVIFGFHDKLLVEIES